MKTGLIACFAALIMTIELVERKLQRAKEQDNSQFHVFSVNTSLENERKIQFEKKKLEIETVFS